MRVPKSHRKQSRHDIALRAILAKFPIEQIQSTVYEHVLPLICLLPDKRLKEIAVRIILGILGGQTPVITEIARQISKDEGETWSGKNLVKDSS